MYLINNLLEVFKIKKFDFLMYFISNSLIILFYFLFFKEAEVLYPIILSGSVFLVFIIVSFVKHCNFKKKISEAKVSPGYKGESLNFFEEMILGDIDDIHKVYQSEIILLKKENEDKKFFISTSIHNIKTSVSVIELATEIDDIKSGIESILKDIKDENNIIKKHLDECLNLIRLDDFSKDYILKEVNLAELVKQVINYKKRDFIYSGIFPKFSGNESVSVLTDVKWLSYIIEQILSNSIKYSDRGTYIDIILKENDETYILAIKDYGIGIKEEDIDRIFEPFFTGTNGREKRGATGIGLYMARLISNKLNHKIYVNSKEGEGSTFSIEFKKYRSILE